ncbi:MAG: ABC transporter substrate-binding protein [Verrucomicrobia bacterium]|nr:ABC transporter substrate-binding protein [Verrucomicrobiota bacterium]
MTCCRSLWPRIACEARRPDHSATGLIRLTVAVTILFILLALESRQSQAAEADFPGEIVFGMSTVLTGSAENLGRDMQRGVLAGFQRANRKGGVNGRKLRLITLDDGYEPARTGPNVRQLIEKDNVLAIIGNVGTPTAIVTVPLVQEEKTLLFAAFSGGPILRNDPPDRYVINFRASYAEEIAAMLDALIDIAGLKPEEIAFFTQRDGYGDAGFVLGISALKRHGLADPRWVLHIGYERNTLAVESAVANLLLTNNPPRAVMMFGAYAPSAKFIRLCRASELNPLFLSVSSVGSGSLAESLGKTDAHVIVTQVVPCPRDDSAPIVREYWADLGAMDPSASAGYGDLEGYIAARIVTLALAKIQGPPTREAIVDALEGLGKFDLGLGEPLYLSRTEHQACHRVWPTVLKADRFESFLWSDLTVLFKGERSP